MFFRRGIFFLFLIIGFIGMYELYKFRKEGTFYFKKAQSVNQVKQLISEYITDPEKRAETLRALSFIDYQLEQGYLEMKRREELSKQKKNTD